MSLEDVESNGAHEENLKHVSVSCGRGQSPVVNQKSRESGTEKAGCESRPRRGAEVSHVGRHLEKPCHRPREQQVQRP